MFRSEHWETKTRKWVGALWNFILKESTVVSGDPSENTSVNIAQK